MAKPKRVMLKHSEIQYLLRLVAKDSVIAKNATTENMKNRIIRKLEHAENTKLPD